MSVETVRVPDIGSDDAVDVIEVPVKAGDQLQAEATIVVLESDKATVEVPLPEAGRVHAVLVKTGDRVRQGDPLLELEIAGQSPRSAAPAAAAELSSQSAPLAAAKTAVKTAATAPGGNSADSGKGAQSAAAGDAEQAPQSGATRAGAPAHQTSAESESHSASASSAVHAGPAVRRLARELGVDLSRLHGSGPRQRVLQEDVHAWVKAALARSPAEAAPGNLPEIDFSRFGEVEQQPQSKLRRLAATNLHRSWQTIPHVTQHDLADITTLEQFRSVENMRLAKQGVKLTPLAFLVRACAVALAQFPRFNSSLSVDGETLIIKRYIHIGVAVETENGLMVPVLRDADRKGVIQIAAEVAELASKARERKLTPADMQGGSFSISSLGGIGGSAFTPIVNWPEVAILGVSKSDWQPCWNGEAFEPRLMLPLSLSYDHRVIDGADAARFITFLSSVLADMRRALL